MNHGLTKLLKQFFPASINWMKVALVAGILAVLYYAYCVQLVEKGVHTLLWLREHWRHISNYSHGPLIPLIAAGLVVWKWPVLRRQPVSPSRSGLWVLVGAMAVYYVSVKAMQPRVVVASFVLVLYGLTLAMAGKDVFRVLFFPITFLFLMVPLDFLDSLVGFPLRTFVAQAATGLLNWLGIQTVRIGTAIHSSVFRFDVADPCSGIRSLMALLTVTAAYAYVTQRQQWKRWVLFLSAMPLAVIGNMVRVTSIALVAQVYGQDLASSVYHDWSGFIVYAAALSAMVLFGMLLNVPYQQIWQQWTRPLQAPVAEVKGDQL
jgi:exosortase